MIDGLLPRLEALARQRDPQGTAGMERNDYVARFTKSGSVHELRLQHIPRFSWCSTYSVPLTGATGRWFLESKWVWFPEKSGCKKVKLAPLDERFKLHASDEAFFREVFGEPKLSGSLMQLPPDNHVKASLKDGVLSLLFRVRFSARAVDPNVILPVCAEAVIAIGLECFSSVQMARLTRGEISRFET